MEEEVPISDWAMDARKGNLKPGRNLLMGAKFCRRFRLESLINSEPKKFIDHRGCRLMTCSGALAQGLIFYYVYIINRIFIYLYKNVYVFHIISPLNKKLFISN